MKALVAAHATAEQSPGRVSRQERYVKLTADFSGTHGTATLIGWKSSVPDQV